jgi:outer membrane protein TolC
VIRAAATRNQLEISLNQLLVRPLEEGFNTAETTITDVGLTQESRFATYLNNPFKFRVLRDFFAEEAVDLAPELRALAASKRAVKRRKTAAKRSFYIPDVQAQASVTHRFYQAGAGSQPLDLPPGIDFPQRDKLDLFVGISAKLPLYASGGRSAELEQTKAEYARVSLQRHAVESQIQQRVRAALHGAGSAYADIQLTGSAASAAQSNLELVKDAYAQGRSPVVALLDAQNNALVAKLASANASLQFLVELMNVERAMGSFSFFIDDGDRKRLFDRLDSYLKKHQLQAP